MDLVQLPSRSPVEPSLPVAVRLKIGFICSIKQEGVGRVLMDHVNFHGHGIMTPDCEDPCYVYLNWFLNHYHHCALRGSCPSCMKLVEWMNSHFSSCSEGRENGTFCPLGAICKEAKKNSLRKFTKPFVERTIDCLNSSSCHSNHQNPQTPGYREEDMVRSSGQGGHMIPSGGYMTPNGGHMTSNGGHMTTNGRTGNGSTGARSDSLSVPYLYGCESPAHSRSPPMSGLRSGGEEVLIPDVGMADIDDPQEKMFNRNMSICSLVSGKGSLMPEQAALFQQLLRRSSTATNAESTVDYSTSSVENCDSFSRQISANLNSIGSINSLIGSRRGKILDSKLTHIQEYATADFDISSSATANTTSSPGRLVKRSSKNKFVNMDHVPEYSDGRGYESPPTHHAPIQRAETGDCSMRMLVHGLRTSPECFSDTDNSGSEDQLSSGELEPINSCSRAPSSSSSGSSSRDDGHISYPVQRNLSVENWPKDKMLLHPHSGRGSITMAAMQSLGGFDLQSALEMGSARANERAKMPEHVGGGGGDDGNFDSVRAKREDFSQQYGGNTYFSSPNVSPRHTAQLRSSKAPVACSDRYYNSESLGTEYRASSKGASGVEYSESPMVDLEKSLESPPPQRNIKSQRRQVEELELDISELSMTRSKAESESSGAS